MEAAPGLGRLEYEGFIATAATRDWYASIHMLARECRAVDGEASVAGRLVVRFAAANPFTIRDSLLVMLEGRMVRACLGKKS